MTPSIVGLPEGRLLLNQTEFPKICIELYSFITINMLHAIIDIKLTNNYLCPFSMIFFEFIFYYYYGSLPYSKCLRSTLSKVNCPHNTSSKAELV